MNKLPCLALSSLLLVSLNGTAIEAVLVCKACLKRGPVYMLLLLGLALSSHGALFAAGSPERVEMAGQRIGLSSRTPN